MPQILRYLGLPRMRGWTMTTRSLNSSSQHLASVLVFNLSVGFFVRWYHQVLLFKSWLLWMCLNSEGPRSTLLRLVLLSPSGKTHWRFENITEIGWSSRIIGTYILTHNFPFISSVEGRELLLAILKLGTNISKRNGNMFWYVLA